MKAFRKKLSALLLAFIVSVSAAAAGTVSAAETAAAENQTNITEAATAEPSVSPTPVPADPSVVSTNGISGWPKIQDLSSDTFCVMDADSALVLADKSDTKQHFPASVTKVLTCLMALKYGNPDDQVTMTQEAVNFAVSGSANLGTQVGEVFTLRDMLYAMMLKSANDIATQVAIYVGGGSLENYYAMANQEVQSMGCVNTNIHSACGMPDDTHYTCAYDLALISREALKYDDFRTIIGTLHYTIPATNLSPARTVDCHHPLLANPGTFPCEGVIGGKTGYTDAAQHVLATYAVRNGRTVIVIQMYDTDMTAECFGAIDLVNYGEDNFENIRVTDDESKIISGGYVTVPKGTKLKDLTLTTEPAAGDGRTYLEFSFNGYEVGRTIMSSADADDYVEAFAAEKEGQKMKSTAEGSAASDRETSGNQRDGSRTVISGDSEQMVLYVLIGLIAVGIACIIITMAVKSSRKNKQELPDTDGGGRGELPETADIPASQNAEKTAGDGESAAAEDAKAPETVISAPKGDNSGAGRDEKTAENTEKDTDEKPASENGNAAEDEPAGGWLDDADGDADSSGEKEN